MRVGLGKNWGVLASSRELIPVAKQSVGAEGGEELFADYFNQGLYQIVQDHILGTASDVGFGEANIYYNGGGNFLDENANPVVFSIGDRITILTIDDLLSELLFTTNGLEFQQHPQETIDLTTYNFRITGAGCRGNLNFINDGTGKVLIEGSGNNLFVNVDLPSSVTTNGQDITINGVTVKSVEYSNIFMNSDAAIAQRGPSLASIANSAYGPDGFIHNKNGAMVSTFNRTSDGPTVAQSGTKVVNCVDLTTTVVDVSLAIGDYCSVSQPIEGKNILDIAGGFATIGFWISSPVAGIHCCAFRNQGSGLGTFASPYIPDRSYIKEYTIDVINTWEFKTFTIPIDDSSGTWDYENGMGLAVTWTLAAGTTWQTTAETWAAGNFLATANQVNVTGIVGAFKIAIPNLIKGQNYNNWTSKNSDLQDSLGRFSSTYPLGVSIGASSQTATAPTGLAFGAGGQDFFDLLKIFFPTKRAIPVVAFYNPSTGASGTFWDYATSVTRGNAVVRDTHSDSVITIKSSTATLLANVIHGVHCSFDSDIYI